MSAKRATRKGRPAPKVAAHAPRGLEIAERGARGYPSVREMLASGKLDAIGDVLRAVLSGAVLASAALGASACGTTAHAGTPPGEPMQVATLAPATPVRLGGPSPSPKPGDQVQIATLVPLPLPPPPPLPGTEPIPPVVAPPPHHPHILPPQPHVRLGGAIAAPRPVPVAVGGAEPAIDF